MHLPPLPRSAGSCTVALALATVIAVVAVTLVAAAGPAPAQPRGTTAAVAAVTSPAAPASPAAPMTPVSPVSPAAPVSPVSPGTPFVQAQAQAQVVDGEPANPALTLRTMSFNILWSFQSLERIETLAEYIRDKQLDVVALQEVYGFWNECCHNFEPGDRNTAEHLVHRLEELGWPMQRSEITLRRSVVFLSRYPMTDIETHPLGGKSHNLQTAMIELPDGHGSFRVGNHHPEPDVDECEHATKIMNVLDELPYEQTVLFGDFNTLSDAPCMSRYLASLQRSCPVDHPDCTDTVEDERHYAIDMILHSREPAGDFASTWQVLDAYSDQTNHVSDHLPVLAVFAVPGARRIAHFEDGIDPRWESGHVGAGMGVSAPVYAWNPQPSPDIDDINHWDVTAQAGVGDEYADMALNLPRAEDWTRYSTLTINQWGWSEGGSGDAGIRVYAHDADAAGNNEGNGYHLLGDFTNGVATIDLTSMTNRDEVDQLLFRTYARVFSSPNAASTHRWHVNDIALGGFGPEEVVLADFETGIDRRLVRGGVQPGLTIDGPFSHGDPPQPGVDDMNYWDVWSTGVSGSQYADMILRITPQDWRSYDQLWIDQWGWSEGGTEDAAIEIYVHDASSQGNNENNGYEFFGSFDSRAALDLTAMTNRSSIDHILFRTRASTFANGASAQHRWHIKSVELRTILLGDVTCDQKVDVVDALAIMQFEVGMRTAVPRCPLPDRATTLQVHNGDVSRDGEVNVIDALFILRCAVGLPTAFCPDDDAALSSRQANSPVAIAAATASKSRPAISVQTSKFASPR